MAKISSQIRLLSKRWDNSQGWPKRLEWLEVNGIRGWTGQRIDFSALMEVSHLRLTGLLTRR